MLQFKCKHSHSAQLRKEEKKNSRKQTGTNFTKIHLLYKIRNRSHRLLVNESYEQLVAVPLINPGDIAEAHMYAREELLVSHILVGYAGAHLGRPPERSVDDALLLAQDIRKQFISSLDMIIDDDGRNVCVFFILLPDFFTVFYRCFLSLLSIDFYIKCLSSI